MARFYPLYVRRSDGKLDVLAKGKRKEINQPTDEQLDQKPDRNGVSDYYREVEMDESKHLDWRRKLGGMLARELEWKDKSAQMGSDTGYMLVTFPEHYRLYEHVKKTEKDGKTEVKSKTHAAGGNDRQDAYLYGHPAGRKKRYRSPADFFPHLLWLCTDESGDSGNCTCKICSPEDLDDLMPGTKPKVGHGASLKVETPTVMQRQTGGQGPTKLKQEPSAPIPAQHRQLRPSVLSQPTSLDQSIDRQYNTFIYRPGELVWFRRGLAWGLAGVLRRWKKHNSQNHYTVQPLSHPFSHAPSVVMTPDSELRPWLAWSVPRYTNELLNNMPQPPSYDSINWHGMMQKQYGTGDPEVDGSILAAKSIDSSYTPFASIRSAEVEPGVTETSYEGIYLGAEKVWVGDPLRVTSGNGLDIVVLQSIIGRRRAGPTSSQQHIIHLIGDVYRIQQVHHANPAVPTPASPANNPQLPPRLTEDLSFRNERSIRAKGVASYWKLMTVNSHVELDSIKGRWYEASLILPVLQQAEFEQVARKGEIGEASLWMNSRGDCVGANRTPNLPRIAKQNIFKATRREAFGQSMPPNAELKEGVDPPLPENVDPALEATNVGQSSMEIDPRFDNADNQASNDETRVSRPGQVHDTLNSGELDEFMNLDGMEEQSHGEIPGFGQHYSQQPSQSGYY